MPANTPDTEAIKTLVGASLYEVWIKLCATIDEPYVDPTQAFQGQEKPLCG